ncbi:photosystem II D1 precursor processing protein PSB27-H2, chloroplastic [Rosa rugosa]|uniref:photosystem II D1 precursor processing protein PSB27-H2, chloroplastic n=1 Tax=Rosa rugosa TaxID=74645 RepID=UPI002B406CAB|nr:photosystem II D1 precursor processing protein PSB27-H2, chloroplastic [Rosa rugosa]XP_061993072.1 photosystem II D1 precursor processing protein PSB27-H2, chloroplastic [Rosa rugosa]
MAASVHLAPELFPLVISRTGKNNLRPNKEYKLHSRCALPSEGASSTRRLVVYAGASILAVLATNYGLVPLPVLADDKSNGEEEKDGVLGAIQSLLETNTKTKSGRVLPKAYLKTAKEVVKTLRESVQEDPKDNAKFRRTADAAKESIREYLSNWRGQPTVSQEESYVELEKAIRSLAGFYSKAGPSAPLPEEVKSEILRDLDTAEKFL